MDNHKSILVLGSDFWPVLFWNYISQNLFAVRSNCLKSGAFFIGGAGFLVATVCTDQKRMSRRRRRDS